MVEFLKYWRQCFYIRWRISCRFIITTYTYYKRKKAHFLFPFFTLALGIWSGMLLTPTIGVICIAASIFLAFVIFVPCEKLSSWPKRKIFWHYFISGIVTFLIIVPAWNKWISIFPTIDPYKQPLRTGKANIEVIAEPSSVIGGMRSFAGLGSVALVKEDDVILEMNAVAARQQLQNNEVRFFARPELDLKDQSNNKQICKIAEAETAIVFFEKLPPKSKILTGEVVLTFNNSIYILIPIPPQTMENDIIIIQDIQKYFKKD